MLPRLEDGVRFYPYELGLLQSSTLERGYLIQFYTEKDQCVALVFVDVRRALMDNLLDQTGPPALINGFTDYYYPKTPPEESQHNRLVPVFSFDRKETIYGAVSRRDAREDAMEPAYPALTYMFRLPADISHPIDRLVGLRTIFEELIQKHATDALDEDFFVYSAYDLDNLTTDQLFALHKETKGMDKDARRSHVAARLSEMGLLDDEEEDEEDVDEE
ncbi:MAG: hypothetical protein UX31_C0038G0008 [Candidatus Nomurabacteria bacterium GW2011_GWA1_46_11]|uniref:Uncharacterized protein n=1 Tax=Candidatus Nomurabacteria bacterium GW2011_GWA1_46_11 TaxID=1618732 RepID=A0A0G1RHU0_9BACT|nr:MAG: hypothetical protein UX31_C0038G0008 [Candidatus Nomurabacteria bacterium GW2011_GWA1_46_11]